MQILCDRYLPLPYFLPIYHEIVNFKPHYVEINTISQVKTFQWLVKLIRSSILKRNGKKSKSGVDNFIPFLLPL